MPENLHSVRPGLPVAGDDGRSSCRSGLIGHGGPVTEWSGADRTRERSFWPSIAVSRTGNHSVSPVPIRAARSPDRERQTQVEYIMVLQKGREDYLYSATG